MPKIAKRKKQDSSDEEQKASSSDSGPEDRNPPKKGNAGKKTTTAAAGTKTGDDEISWQLEGSKVLKVRTFKGKTYIDIREYYEKDGKQLPGKKGISLTPSVWKKLIELVPEVDKALEEI